MEIRKMAMFGMSIKTTTEQTLFQLNWTYLQEVLGYIRASADCVDLWPVGFGQFDVTESNLNPRLRSKSGNLD